MVTGLEIVLAFLSNIQGFFTFFGVISYTSIICVLFYLGWAKDCGDDSDVVYAKKLLKTTVIIALSLSPVMALPSLKDLWEVRIALIKFQLASPENVQKGVETIERLGKKLECKYIGGNECKETR